MVYDLPKDLQEIELAKQMISGGDYLGARKILLEVRRNFPAFDDISGMIAVCDILFSAGLGFIDFDFYFILQLSPESTSYEIKSKYNKFVTLLEPIINDFPGAASALRIVENAFSVLFHQEKRRIFDIKRVRRLESCVSNVNSVVDSKLVTEILTQRHEAAPSLRSWRMSSCKIGDGTGNMYESNSMEIASKIIVDAEVFDYLGERRVCDSKLPTQAGFLKPKMEIYDQEASWISTCAMSSIDTMAGSSYDKISPSICLSGLSKKSTYLSNCNQDYHNFDKTKIAELSSVGHVWATYDEEGMPRKYARIICIDEFPVRSHVSWFKPVSVTAHERRWCELKMPVVCGLFNLDVNERAVLEETSFSHLIDRHGSEQIEIYPQSGEIWAIYRDWRPLEWLSNPRARKECTLDVVEIINGYFNFADVIVRCLVKAQGFNNVFRRCTDNDGDHTFAIPGRSLYKFSHRIPAYRFAGREMDGISYEMFQLDHLAAQSVLDWDMARGSSNHSSISAIPLYNPLDAETKVLKHKWSIKDFTSEQVWAIYYGQDLMPRRYVVVNNVISWSKVSSTLLELHSMVDEEISWVQDNPPFASGLFKCGETTLDLDISRFSHIVNCEKTGQSLYKIYPKKGEVWAIYKNSDGTKKLAEFNSHHQCQIVEIVTDFCEESGLTAVILTEVPGWKSFFKRQLHNGNELRLLVKGKEMVYFSHQVPAYTVEGIELHGIPKGSWHLEPDALPPTLNVELC